MGGGLCPFTSASCGSVCIQPPRALPDSDGQRPPQHMCLWGGFPADWCKLGASKSLKR